MCNSVDACQLQGMLACQWGDAHAHAACPCTHTYICAQHLSYAHDIVIG